jgi:hypothetical protein
MLIDEPPTGMQPAMPTFLARFVVPRRFSALQTQSYGAYVTRQLMCDTDPPGDVRQVPAI